MPVATTNDKFTPYVTYLWWEIVNCPVLLSGQLTRQCQLTKKKNAELDSYPLTDRVKNEL